MIRKLGKSRVSVLLIVTDGELDDRNSTASAVSVAYKHFCHVHHHVDNDSLNVVVINSVQLTLNLMLIYIIILLYTYYMLH